MITLPPFKVMLKAWIYTILVFIFLHFGWYSLAGGLFAFAIFIALLQILDIARSGWKSETVPENQQNKKNDIES